MIHANLDKHSYNLGATYKAWEIKDLCQLVQKAELKGKFQKFDKIYFTIDGVLYVAQKVKK